jgi:hypothetical protein
MKRVVLAVGARTEAYCSSMRYLLNLLRMVQCILDSERIMIVVCYLMSGSCVSFIRDFGSVTLLFSNTLVSGV